MKISVIIATYNRMESLRNTLEALVNQDFSKSDFEVLVVDDGSSDNTQQVLAGFKNSGLLDLHFFHQQNRGPAAARNLALRQAGAEIIAFTDDDCIPQPGWLTAIAKGFESGEIIGLQGRTYTDKKGITPLTHQIDNPNGSKDVPTCNAAYRRNILTALDGFDNQFPYPHNEDADLAWRAEKLGTIAFCKDMLVYHPPRADKFSKVAGRMKIMESEFRLFYKDREGYIKNRSASPWKNIYWGLGVKTQFYYLRSRFKFLGRPVLFIEGLALTFIWWWDLIRFYPRFLRADKLNRELFEQASSGH